MPIQMQGDPLDLDLVNLGKKSLAMLIRAFVIGVLKLGMLVATRALAIDTEACALDHVFAAQQSFHCPWSVLCTPITDFCTAHAKCAHEHPKTRRQILKRPRN